ncbi:hypothetical protein HS1_002404 [Candidatus Desulfofervidus auxilii]|uniref:Uncharacterized protein n=1 Tax=Desulfofervidus auxilii TaxID=1621989 RepID=A0A7U4QMT1_DESA2|nr:hypothetical protein [Candidatus Desulfofervidus auxilii]AMM42186.1 hypothetical protein HS1_002404 [Candidatus Desulfofervidus auxilii]
MSKIVTPEVLLQKFSDRLKSKSKDLKYLIYMGKHFEKWLQCELVLSMSDIALPGVFDDNFKEMIYDESGTKEKVCDITMEYPIEGKEPRKTDVIIAENPFLFKFADKENWQIFKQVDVKKCKTEYRNTKFHYVELKQINWVDINSPGTKINKIVDDLKKYSDLDWRSFKPVYNPSSVISMCCISFWDSSNPSRDISRSEIYEAAKKVGRNICKKCDVHYKISGSFLCETVTDEICLLLVFYNI